jgi:hypothetical protein
MRRPIDTSSEARERQLEMYRAMRPEERVRLADQMSEEVKALARAGIRARLGDVSEAAVDEELTRILLGDDIADTVRRRRQPAGRR